MKSRSIFLSLLLHVPIAHAGEAVDKALDVRPDGWVRIDNVRGRIEVGGWDKNQVTVNGTLDDEAERLVFETDGATTTVKVVTPNNLKHGAGSNLVIRVPVASPVRVEVVSADLHLTNLQGGVEGKSVSGAIDANGLGKRIEFSTVSGDIAVAQSNGPLELHSVSGDMTADVDTESVDVGTVSGDAHVRSAKAVATIALNSVSGDIDVDADLSSGARVKGSSVSGDIHLAINPNADAVIDLNATAGGSIKNSLTSDVPAKQGYGPGRQLQFTLGAGKGAIDLTTVSGTLALAPRQ
jgi:DUF4097 and DUF4098 domain-containing protein YvlB